MAVWQETLLGGALQFLAEIGEDISVSIPNRQLHDGDFIEIDRQVRNDPPLFAAHPMKVVYPFMPAFATCCMRGEGGGMSMSMSMEKIEQELGMEIQ